MAKTKDWGLLEPGTVLNSGSFFRVANMSDARRWWKGAKAYSFESYATREQAEARVRELRDAKASSLDEASTLTWVNLATSYGAEKAFHASK